MQPLDIHTFPLTGQSLIEASAGTGKTYTIASLYSRLLLGHNTRRLSCDQILVVTFTNAATEELRGRIRERIRLMLGDVLRLMAAFEETETAPASTLQIDSTVKVDSTLQTIAPDLRRWLDDLGLLVVDDQTGTRLQALADWLNTNLSQMDNASIYTIHGFCQRMLKQFAFDSGVMFSAELLLDTQSYLRQACEDVWRNGNYRLDAAQVGYLMERYPTPAALQKEVSQWLSHPQIVFLPQPSESRETGSTALDFAAGWHALQEQFEQLASAWQQVGSDGIADLIQSSGVDKRSFTKKNLPRWLAAAQAWFDGTFCLPVPAALENFGQRNLYAKTKADKTAPEHRLFAAVDAFLDQERQLAVGLPQVWFERVRERYIALMSRAGVMSPDDLLRLLDTALSSPQGEGLAAQIQRLHPVGLIDEFQDTDPLQYRIFTAIYRSQHDASSSADAFSDVSSGSGTSPGSDASAAENEPNEWGLAAIGDPKQAIYAFRGADIFTYIAARRALMAYAADTADASGGTVSAPVFTLSTNWRSHTRLVAGVNQLFERHPAPFVFDQDIPFVSVQAAGKEDDQGVTVAGESLAPLQLWLDNTPYSLPQARWAAARQCAERIHSALSGAILLGKTPVTARDTAVLVRSHQQADMMRKALAERNIGSVFLSRDSVLDSREAHDLLMWLTAVAEPSDERSVRRAMATETQGFDAATLDRLLNDELAWENRLEDMARYHQIWQQQGVMAALMRWLEDDKRAVRLRCFGDGERRLTNLLHLGEMLQQASRRLRGHLSLLRWFTEQVFDDDSSSDEAQLRLETDANLVSIVTIHKSKGLEYPLVFLPFLWSDDFSSQSGREARYFDDELGVVVNLEPDDAARQAQYRDNQAEAMRLLYVALTRPVQGCFIWLMNAGKANKKRGWAARIQTTALGRLLQVDQFSTSDGSIPGEQSWCEWLQQHWQQSGLNDLTDQLTLSAMPAWHGDQVPMGNKNVGALAVAAFERRLTRHWRVSSFTQLSSHAHSGRGSGLGSGQGSAQSKAASSRLNSSLTESGQPVDSLVDAGGSEDNVLRTDDDAGHVSVSGMLDLESIEPVYANSVEQTAAGFPRGATAGTCLHAMLEHWDFHDQNLLQCDIIPRELQHFGLHPVSASASEEPAKTTEPTEPEAQHQLVADWLQQVVDTELRDDCGNTFRLSELEASERLDEMEFCLPVQRDGMLHSEALNALLAEQGSQDRSHQAGPNQAQSNQAQSNQAGSHRSLVFEPLNGYLKGFIDLMFCLNGRYYLVDYKSNWLGETSTDYQQDALHAAMTSHHYDLQAWIYTLALDQLLARRLPDYDPEKHLGGAFYLFLRGMTGTRETTVERGEQSDLFAETTSGQCAGVHYQAVSENALKRWKQTILGEACVGMAGQDMAGQDMAGQDRKSVADNTLEEQRAEAQAVEAQAVEAQAVEAQAVEAQAADAKAAGERHD